jgi:hypothetical protein
MEIRDQRQLLRHDGLLLLPMVSQSGVGRVQVLRHHSLTLRPVADAPRSNELGAGDQGVREQVLVSTGMLRIYHFINISFVIEFVKNFGNLANLN